MAKGELFGQLPTWAKGIIAIAVVGGVAFVGYKIFKAVQKSQGVKGDKDQVDSTKTDLAQLNTVPATKQTLTNAQALTLANALHKAMDGNGTDMTAISKQLLQLKNQADWLAVVAAYGVGTLKATFFDDVTGSLTTNLASEAGDADAPYTTQLNKYFKQRGISAVL